VHSASMSAIWHQCPQSHLTGNAELLVVATRAEVDSITKPRHRGTFRYPFFFEPPIRSDRIPLEADRRFPRASPRRHHRFVRPRGLARHPKPHPLALNFDTQRRSPKSGDIRLDFSCKESVGAEDAQTA
jgi:hypothetical protein